MGYKELNLRNDLMEFAQYEDFPVERYNDFFHEFPNCTLPAHWHDEIEINCVIEDCVTYYVNSQPYSLKKGDTILINSKRMHYAKGNTNSKVLGFVFHSNLMHASIGSKYVYPLMHSKVDAMVLSSKDVWNMVYSIYQLNEKDVSFELSCLEYILRIFHSFYDSFLSMHATDSLPNIQSELLMEMITYMHIHYKEKITIKQLSSLVGISQSSCFRLFKTYTSLSPIAYLNDYRLRLSTLSLRTTQKSMTEIALECGFENQSYFTLLFKRKYGTSPLKYRKSG